MKRIIALLLCVFMIMAFSGCNSGESQSNEQNTENASINIDVKGKKAPSKDMILEDFQNSLAAKNAHAVITEINTVKSLTEEGLFSITLTVAAETKYAEWSYEVNMAYTKYDQGWMMDNITWVSDSYSVVHIPDSVAMTELANNFFSTHEDERMNDLAKIQTGTAQVVPNEDYPKETCISFSWNNVTEFLHGHDSAEYMSYWCYNVEADTWIPVEEENPTDYRFCGYAIFRTSNLVIDADLSGKWKLANGNLIAISDFTPDYFTASWEGKTAKFDKNAKIPYGFNTDRENSFWYGDSEQGYYLIITLTEKTTSISIFTYEGLVTLIAMGSISEALPKLQG